MKCTDCNKFSKCKYPQAELQHIINEQEDGFKIKEAYAMLGYYKDKLTIKGTSDSKKRHIFTKEDLKDLTDKLFYAPIINKIRGRAHAQNIGRIGVVFCDLEIELFYEVAKHSPFELKDIDALNVYFKNPEQKQEYSSGCFNCKLLPTCIKGAKNYEWLKGTNCFCFDPKEHNDFDEMKKIINSQFKMKNMEEKNLIVSQIVALTAALDALNRAGEKDAMKCVVAKILELAKQFD